MTRIYTDENGSYANAISTEADGTDVRGHLYHLAGGPFVTTLRFQLGPVKEVGVNGVTNEAVLEVLLHRMQHLNAQFPCRENSLAITNLEQALMWLERRTRNRKARGVEGTNAL